MDRQNRPHRLSTMPSGTTRRKVVPPVRGMIHAKVQAPRSLEDVQRESTAGTVTALRAREHLIPIATQKVNG